MYHRHLTHQNYTLAAIDDIIGRGRLEDWTDLRDSMRHDRSTLEKVLKIARARASAPYAQRYRFWEHYAENRLA